MIYRKRTTDQDPLSFGMKKSAHYGILLNSRFRQKHDGQRDFVKNLRRNSLNGPDQGLFEGQQLRLGGDFRIIRNTRYDPGNSLRGIELFGDSR